MLENTELHSTQEQSFAKHHITEAEDLAFVFTCAYRHMQRESESKHPIEKHDKALVPIFAGLWNSWKE